MGSRIARTLHRVRRRAGWVARSAPLGVEAAVFLGWASLAVRLLPAPRITRLLGRPGPPARALELPGACPHARRVGRAVERVAALLPWPVRCLPQAIAARAMLRRRAILSEGHLGVVATAPLTAHAWVTVGGVAVQGGPVGNVTEVAVLH